MKCLRFYFEVTLDICSIIVLQFHQSSFSCCVFWCFSKCIILSIQIFNGKIRP